MALAHGEDVEGKARALSVTNEGAQEMVFSVPRTAVTPDVSSSPTAFQRFGDGSATIYYFRVTVNAGDDPTAGSRLSTMQQCHMLRPDESLMLSADAAMTRVDIVAVGSAESASLSSGEVVVEDTATSTAADYQTAMVTFVFEASDNIKGVTLSASDRQSNNVTISVDGSSY